MENQQPTPQLIFETLNAYQRTAALRTGIEFDVFTVIAEGANTAEALAAKTGAAERGMRILCDYLAVMGLLTKEGNRYGLSPDAAVFLNRHSPACIAAAVTFLNSKTLMQGFENLGAAVKKGGSAIEEEGTTAPDHPVWVEFARAMAPLQMMPSELIAQLIGAAEMPSCKVLDIAAGHGVFGIAIARHNPNAEIVALDWAAVLEVAKENAAHAGIADRYRTIPGSAFDVDMGEGYDLVLLTNFLHHFDKATCESLLKKVHTALKPGGRAVTYEFVPNEDRVSPPVPAGFSMIMLATTPHGDAYTFSEYEEMFGNTGFAKTELHQLPPTMQQVLISEK
jgi:ubiquinone/menaquinone biosynthesis C-methylase UbiE